MLIQTSARPLRRYKNFVSQTSGITEIFQWLHHAPKVAKVSPHGLVGGLHHNETKSAEIYCIPDD